MTYDNLNRLVTKDVPDRSGLATTHTRDVYFGYDLFGNMTYARFGSDTGEGITNVFDALGRLTSTTNNLDSISRELEYLYDVAGNLTQLKHPDGNYFTYARNSVGGLDQINLNDSTPLLKPVLDAQARLYRVDRWRTSPGDWLARTTFSFDAISRLDDLITNVNGTSYDSTTSFTYNPASQMTSVTRTNDAYAWTGQANSDKTYTADGLNRYSAVASVNIGYDANHNLTSDGTNTYVYDVENRLLTRSGGGSATLHYDPLGRLHKVVSGSTTRLFLYDGSDLVAEYNASGTRLRRYVHGEGAPDDPKVWFEGSGVGNSARRNLYADERGSIVAVTDSAGAVTNVNTYDEYGVPGSGNVGAFQYTGQVWLPELGLYYYKARMYSPTLGRFMQTDPIGYGDGMNMYAYVGNNPVNAIDPSGLTDLEWFPHPCPNAPEPPEEKPFDGPVLPVTGSNSCGSWVPRIQQFPCLSGVDCHGPQGQEPSYGACRYAPLSDADKKLASEILAAATVRAAIDLAWQKTTSSGNEHGFLIYRNSGGFGPGVMHEGTPLGVRGIYMEFLGRRADGLSLPVASLHTHPGNHSNMQFPSMRDVHFFNRETGTLGFIKSTFGLTAGRTCQPTGNANR